MKHVAFFLIFILLICWFSGCTAQVKADIAATTMPVYSFTARLCEGTPMTVTRLVTESVSCLHDYTLQVGQMRTIQGAKAVVISGAGLEDFLEDALHDANHIIDASESLSLLEGEHHDHAHHGHTHAEDPHIWLSPENATLNKIKKTYLIAFRNITKQSKTRKGLRNGFGAFGAFPEIIL